MELRAITPDCGRFTVISGPFLCQQTTSLCRASQKKVRKKTRACLTSRSRFIHKLALCFDRFLAACVGQLPSAGNMLFRLCGLCVCKVSTERGCGGGVGGSECDMP